MQTVGERIRAWRKENKLTMIDIQNATGITQGAMTKYENNKSMIGGAQLIKLYDYYRIDILYILTGETNTKTEKQHEQSENDTELLQLFHKLTEREQIKAIARMEDLVDKYTKI